MRSDKARVHAWISGMVQGVNFRYTTRRRAEQRGLAGWVRNLPDGRVEAVFEGDPEGVKTMLDWCHQGPRMARVDGVDVEWEEPEGLDAFGVSL